MGTKQVAEATTKVLQSYLTYQAVKTILMELAETNPPQALWLNHYLANHSIQDGEAFLEELLNDNKELVLRILTIREVLADVVLDFLPGMVRQSISHSNMEHRRHLLERLTRSVPQPESDLPDFPFP